jgi:deoxycytidine triphosphate deaminase
MNDDLNGIQFPVDGEEATKRFEQFKSLDPLPNIPPALLNSGDIYDYARITGMVYPFNHDHGTKKLKSASYEIDFLGEIYWVDENDKSHKQSVKKKDDYFDLKKNSIAYIYLETEFRLPDYLAIRFNLKITCVHRGLLLGTGPLVDPGFCGRLLVPLHNLTSEDYRIYGGDGLIWVEFTKLSPHAHWGKQLRANAAPYIPFPKNKAALSPIEYFKKASGGIPARSSIPGEIKTAVDSAKDAKSLIKFLTISGLIAIIALVWATWQLIQDANQNIRSQNGVITDLRLANFELQLRVKQLEDLAPLPEAAKELKGSGKVETVIN